MVLISLNHTDQDYHYNQKMNDVNRLKRNLTLDLHIDTGKTKRSKFGPATLEAQVLSSPDMKHFTLNSPDIEKFLMQNGNNILQTPTPNTMRLLFPKSEPELLGETFVQNTLNDLDNDSVPLVLPKNNPTNYADEPYPVSLVANYSIIMSPEIMKIKEEPQTVPNIDISFSPPVSPINMESQEQIKTDRKKARNRVAAAKCRKKKLEKIATLEDKVKQLKDDNVDLGQVIAKLKQEVFALKEKVLKHHNNGCLILPSSDAGFS